MSFRSAKVLVSGATQLVAAQAGDVEVWVRGVPDVFIGADNTVDADGFPLSSFSFVLQTRVRPGDELWAYHDTGIYVSVLVRSA